MNHFDFTLYQTILRNFEQNIVDNPLQVPRAELREWKRSFEGLVWLHSHRSVEKVLFQIFSEPSQPQQGSLQSRPKLLPG